MKIKKTLAAIALAAAIGISGCKSPKELVDWTRYSGKSSGYEVRIEETGTILGSDGNRMKEIVIRLDTEDRTKIPYSISGRDYDGNGTWDRIGMIPESKNGYNSIKFIEYGRVWEPCGADKDRLEEFTPNQIREARILLDRAMIEVCNDKHKGKTEKVLR